MSYCRGLASLFLVIACVLPSRAEIVVTNVFDTSSPTVLSIASRPSLNTAGQAAFGVLGVNGFQILRTEPSGGVTTIADQSGELSSFPGDPWIASSGQVGFNATFDGGGSGIMISDGSSPPTIIADDRIPSSNISPLTLSDSPRLNHLDQMGFEAVISGVRSVVRGDTGGTDVFVDQSEFAELELAPPGINDNGILAFTGRLQAFDRSSVYFGTESGFSPAFVPTDGDAVGSPAINLPGNIATRVDLDAGGEAIVVGQGSQTRVVAMTSDLAAVSLSDPGIDRNSRVAFEVDFGGDVSAIYFVDRDGMRELVRVGDSFEGSMITDLEFQPGGLNEGGQVVFGYTLANGIQGIAIASIPEPSTFGFVALGFAVGGWVLRRRTSRS